MAEAASCPVPDDLDALLPGYSFADAYEVPTPDGLVDARVAARKIFSRQPGWITGLIRLRDRIVVPLGLKGTDNASAEASVGGFPLVNESERRVILGFDDKHLDFRIVVDAVSSVDSAQVLRATTLVKPHNFAGRVYLAFVLPFHRAIVPRMLNRLKLGPISATGE